MAGGDGARLEERVLGERGAGLFDAGVFAGDVPSREDLADFTQLVGVVRGDNQGIHSAAPFEARRMHSMVSSLRICSMAQASFSAFSSETPRDMR